MVNPVVLIIRDGWGENHNTAHDSFNAVKLASTPCGDLLRKSWPRTEIQACGLDVGLPEGVMGNSEVGHQNIGAGRVVDQEIVRINKVLDSENLQEIPVLKKGFEYIEKTGGALHLLGLVSDAGVHSHLNHLYSLLRIAKNSGVEKVLIHAFTDGRDTPPKSGKGYIEEIEKHCGDIGVGKIATVSGRFWSMDRDRRWNRVEKAYNALIGESELKASSAGSVLEHYYQNPTSSSQKGDEFVPPTIIVNDQSHPIGSIQDGDAVLFFNFRGDRPRELVHAFLDEHFSGFDRGSKKELFFMTMCDYEEGLCKHVLFPKPTKMKNILGSYLSNMGFKQFRCAETEKYPHVTFFFNDYRDEPFEGEDRVLVPSPKEVDTYDQKPQMSADAVTQAVQEAILSAQYRLIVVNYANADMVGHTGSLDAAIKACEAVDQGVSLLLQSIDEVEGMALVTADHGNSDQMIEGDVPHTRHTLNPVEVILYGKGCEDLKLKKEGRLADIAPTLLKLMGLEKPEEMTGSCLIV